MSITERGVTLGACRQFDPRADVVDNRPGGRGDKPRVHHHIYSCSTQQPTRPTPLSAVAPAPGPGRRTTPARQLVCTSRFRRVAAWMPATELGEP